MSPSDDSRPVLILQHLSADGPGHLGLWLAARGIQADVRNAENGADYPLDLRRHRALAVLGGEMSANDELPALRHAERLIRLAMDSEVPVIGHCLGGQLMARALGARIVASPAPEIGWQSMTVLDSPEAAAWLGSPGARTVFQWHFEAFELPVGAVSIAASASCVHQAFSIGPHLAMQFHVEVDEDKIDRWSREEGLKWAEAQRHFTVQDGPAMRVATPAHLPVQQALADRLYSRWLNADAGKG